MDVPPGPELSAVLAKLDLSRLDGFDCVEVLKAQYRQLNHDRARLMATMVEVGLADIGMDDEPRRLPAPTKFSADEVHAALVLARRARKLLHPQRLRALLPVDLHPPKDRGPPTLKDTSRIIGVHAVLDRMDH